MQRHKYATQQSIIYRGYLEANNVSRNKKYKKKSKRH